MRIYVDITEQWHLLKCARQQGDGGRGDGAWGENATSCRNVKSGAMFSELKETTGLLVLLVLELLLLL